MKTIGYTTESVIADMEKRPDANHPIWGEPLPGHPDIPLVRRSEAEAEIAQLREELRLATLSYASVDAALGQRNAMCERLTRERDELHIELLATKAAVEWLKLEVEEVRDKP